MDNLKVIDSDFITRVSRICDVDSTSRPLLDLQVLSSSQHVVYKAHMDYLRAGAKIIKTNTCRTNAEFVMKNLHVSKPQAKFITITAVEIAKTAVLEYYKERNRGNIFDAEEFKKHRALIAGCCGSYSVTRIDQDGPVQYWNFIPQKVIVAWHYSHIRTLLSASVDLLAFESIPSLMEAKALITILINFPATRAWITFSCSKEGKLADENTFTEAAAYCYDLLPDQIVAIGANCLFPNSMKPLMKSINDSRDSKIPFIFYVDKNYLLSMEKTNEYDVKLWDNFIQECLDIGIRYISSGSNTSLQDIKNISEQIEIYRFSKDRTVTLTNSY